MGSRDVESWAPVLPGFPRRLNKQCQYTGRAQWSGPAEAVLNDGREPQWVGLSYYEPVIIKTVFQFLD